MSKGKTKVVLNIAGFNALRKCPEVFGLVEQCAAEKKKALGRGYEYEVRQSGTRCVGKVFADTKEAEADNFKNNSILKR